MRRHGNENEGRKELQVSFGAEAAVAGIALERL